MIAPVPPDPSTASSPTATRAVVDREFSELALPHLDAVARVARALAMDESNAEDLVQETFLRAYKHWHTFDKTADCRRWLSTICRNAFLEQRKRDGRYTAVEDAELESLAAARLHNTVKASGLDGMFSRLDLGPAIARAIDALDPNFRDVVVLVDVEDFSYEQVAETLSIPIGTVRSRLYRARRALQEALLAYAVDAGFATASQKSPPPPPPPTPASPRQATP
jgi:RNA polymerase sigma-70 factor (ECF subfamily)